MDGSEDETYMVHTFLASPEELIEYEDPDCCMIEDKVENGCEYIYIYIQSRSIL